jgi:hypothetical protein
VDTPGYAMAVAVSADYAYIADADRGLQVVDVADPSSPQIVGALETIGDAGTIAVDSMFAYVGSFDALSVIDVHDPFAPQLVGSVAAEVRSITVQWPYAYVVARPDLMIVDITNPASPQIVGQTAIAGRPTDVSVAGSFAYVSLEAGIEIVDVSNPSSPRLLGAIDTAGDGRAVVVSGSFVYLSAVNWGLHVLPTQCATPTAAPEHSVPRNLVLAPFPNPTRGETRFLLSLVEAADVRMLLVDAGGRLVRRLAAGRMEPGTHTRIWDGTTESGHAAASGIYYVRVESGQGVIQRNLVYLR